MMEMLMETEQADTALYLAAVERYASNDFDFRMKADRVRAIIATAEPNIDPAALTGALWGATTALHLVEAEGRAEQAAEPFDPLALAELLNTSLRQLADVIKGGTQTLVGEGFEPELARAVVLSIVFKGIIGGSGA